MYARFSYLVPLVYLLSQVVSCVSVFLGYPFLNVSSVFLFGPYGLLTFTGSVLCVRVSVLSVLECILRFSCMVPLVYILSQVVSCGVRVSVLSVLECTLGFPVWSH